MSEGKSTARFTCSVCGKDRKLVNNVRKQVSYIETIHPRSERAICFSCIKDMTKGVSNAKR